MRRLLPLGAAVVAAHGLLLSTQAPLAMTPSTPTALAFATREIEPPPPMAPAPAQPAVAPVRVARSRSTPAELPPPATAAAERAPPAPTEPEQAASSDAAPALTQALAAPAPAASNEPLSAVPPHPAAVPPPARMRYELQATYRGLTLGGHAQLDWWHDGSRYEARLEIGAPLLPSRVQTSSGLIAREGLQPQRFSDKVRDERAAHFQRDKGRITFSNNKPEAELLAGAQDRLSVVIQLAALIGGQPARYPAGTRIGIPTAGTAESDTWVFTVEGDEDLQLPAGALRALKLQRAPRKEFDIRVEIWLAPRLDYAPVRIRLTHPNGDSVDQRWSSTDKG